MAILLAALFLPNIAIGQGAPAPTPTPTPATTCDLTKLTKAIAKADYSFEPSGVAPLSPDQVFQLGIKITNITDQQLAEACNKATLKIKATYRMYVCSVVHVCPPIESATWASGNMEGTAQAVGDADGKQIGFGGLFQPTTLKQIMRDSNNGVIQAPNTSVFPLYIYVTPEIFISNENSVRIPIGDNYAFYREVKFNAPVGDPGAVDPNFAPAVKGTSVVNEGAQNTLGSKLFDFLRQVIAYIVLLITSFVYYIFSSILVPVIVALIKVRPYQDTFVNFIYPGWVIIRNISNIFFIVALLWVGLRTLFQLDEAGKSRGFIVRLILAALLVNFSLVIGQAIVGIADTLQAQFLPGDTKVVETLGFKLMVDPIQTFRGVEGSSPEDYKLAEEGNYTSQALASDLPKAIILLVLAVAAFFAFVALTAFLLVRLVILWILYMVSPLAYVGKILPQTEKYADQWWQAFLKYSFAVPIMAFFLNITALLAVTISPTTGQSVNNTGNAGVLGGLIPSGGVADNFVSFVTTVLSHFIVLAFLFAGMKFALAFGGAGSKQIVGAAKSGFKKAFEYPWRGAKGAGRYARDGAASWALDRESVKNRPKLASTISAVAQPTATAKALRDKLFTQPKKKQLEKIAKARDPMLDFAGNVGNNKKLAAKMAYWKMTGQSAKAVQARQSEFGKLLTEAERDEKRDKIKSENAQLRRIQQKLGNPANDMMTKAQGLLYQQELQKKLDEANKKQAEELKELEDLRVQAAAKGNTEKAADYEDDITKLQEKHAADRRPLESEKADIDDWVNSLPANATSNLAFQAKSADQAAKALNINAEVVQAKINTLEEDIKNDNSLRRNLDVDEWDDDDRNKVSEGLTKVITSREWDGPGKDRSGRIANENTEGKKLEGIDDPEAQVAAFNTALSKNNMALASAIAKKMSKEGNFADLLKSAGYNNNLEDFKKFMAEKFKDQPIVVRNQIASELSNLNMQNGNRALGYATTVDSKGVINWRSKAQQETQLEKSAGKKKPWEKKFNEMFEETSSGEYRLIKGEEKEVHKMANNPDMKKHIMNRMSTRSAETLLKMHEAAERGGKSGLEKPLHTDIADALRAVTGK